MKTTIAILIIIWGVAFFPALLMTIAMREYKMPMYKKLGFKKTLLISWMFWPIYSFKMIFKR